jgi:RNA polymerase sigma-70 factor (ECF subfamily)
MESLIGAFRAGEPEAVRAVYQRFARPVATVARSIAGDDQALVDDIVQQTFTKAWQAAATFDGDRDLAPWLYTIARRTAIDAVRHERRPTRSGHEPEVEVAVGPVSLEQTWEAFEVRHALEELPSDEKTVVMLNHVGGLTHDEIARRLGVPIGTVKSRSHRAHRRLAVALRHLQPEPAEDWPPPRTPEPQPAPGGSPELVFRRD